jgi:hypothetical protein
MDPATADRIDGEIRMEFHRGRTMGGLMMDVIFDLSPSATIWGVWTMMAGDMHWILLCWQDEDGQVMLKHRTRSGAQVHVSQVETGADPQAMIARGRVVAAEMRETIAQIVARHVQSATGGRPPTPQEALEHARAAVPLAEEIGPMTVDEFTALAGGKTNV